MIVYLKICVSWCLLSLVVACPVWGSHMLFEYGMKSAAISVLAGMLGLLVAMWRGWL